MWKLIIRDNETFYKCKYIIGVTQGPSNLFVDITYVHVHIMWLSVNVRKRAQGETEEPILEKWLPTNGN